MARKPQFQNYIDGLFFDARVLSSSRCGGHGNERDICDCIAELVFQGIKEEAVRSRASLLYRELLEASYNTFGNHIVISKGGKTCTFVNDDGCLEIMLNSDTSQDEIGYVFIHELGEATFLAKRFPTTDRFKELIQSNASLRLLEVFSHTYIHRELDVKGLCSLEKPVTEDMRELYRKGLKKTELVGDDKLGQLIVLVWLFASYPIWDQRQELGEYNVHSESINRIWDILNAPDLFTSPEEVFRRANEILGIIRADVACMEST